MKIEGDHYVLVVEQDHFVDRPVDPDYPPRGPLTCETYLGPESSSLEAVRAHEKQLSGRYGKTLVAKLVFEPTPPATDSVHEADALNALKALLGNEHVTLDDLVYAIREREGLGWEGPSVKAWSDAVTKAKAVVAKTSSPEGQ